MGGSNMEEFFINSTLLLIGLNSSNTGLFSIGIVARGFDQEEFKDLSWGKKGAAQPIFLVSIQKTICCMDSIQSKLYSA